MAVSFETGAEPIPGYKLLGRLGSGGFGEVWKCEAPGGIFKAVKVIHGDLRYKETDSYRFAEQELKSLKRVKMVRHPYLLALDRYDIVDGRLVITMELADCNLWDRFRECRGQGKPGIPRDELMQYMLESAEVLDLMNDTHQLQHLDIKPQNLFLLYNHVKVADFGQVKDLELHVAQVTGGITPVYAAPETFDGFVSRYCDQYSLACVYQELLTGVRPFDGTSMNQLLMQHLQQPPNLTPSPPADRPALARALSKKPEDRFQTVMGMVKAIRDGMPAAATTVPVLVAVGAVGTSAEPSFALATAIPSLAGNTGYADATYIPNSVLPPSAGQGYVAPVTPYPRAGAETSPAPERIAPPEQTGPGALRPAIIIGIGYTGQRVLRRFHRLVSEHYGATRRVPLVRTIYLDTDPDAGGDGEREFGPLPDDSVVPTPLNRAAYYLRPRNNGRALIEGWFDASVLYRLPRAPVTTGLRSLGRLAFCDHYRAVMQKVQTEIETVVDPISAAVSRHATGLEMRTNRPRVYVVAGLGGGTGSGMALDVAYAVKHRLRRLGYAAADVVGLLLAPSADGTASPQARANTFAALTELNHFSRPDTAYIGGYDEQAGMIRDDDPPFTRTLLLPGYEYAEEPSVTQTSLPSRRPKGGSSTATNGSLHRTPAEATRTSDPAVDAAECLRIELFTSIGHTADEARSRLTPPDVPAAGTSGFRRFGWPRAAVVARTARVIAPVLLGQWVAPDPMHVRDVVPQWTTEQWRRLGLDGESIAGRLRRAGADRAANAPVAELIRQTVDPLIPKGWLAKPPEPQAVAYALDRLTALLGPPRDNPNRQPTDVEQAVAAEGKVFAKQVTDELMALVPALLDTQAFRLAGTEEVIRHLLLAVGRNRALVEGTLGGHEKAAGVAYDRLAHHVHQQKGTRKLTGAEFGDALRDYPAAWYQVVVGRQVVGVYARLHEALLTRLNELSACRQRIQEHHVAMAAAAETPAPPAHPDDLLPLGCGSIEDAAQRFLKVLNDDDLNELEQRFQRQITAEFGGVFESCLNSADGPHALTRILRDVTRDYLNERMGDVDLYGMMKHKFAAGGGVGRAIEAAIEEAAPTLVGRGPWSQSEVCAFAAPDGPGGLPITQRATTVLPPIASVSGTPDEVIVYREFAHVPLAALDQFGPAWAAAYKAAPDLLQASPHARTDITRWLHVDE